MHYLLYGTIIVLSIMTDMRLMYALFIVLLLCNIKYINNENLFLSIAVASIILPDNYSTEICFLLYFIMNWSRKRRCKIKKTPYTLLLLFFFFIIIISTILNHVPMTNIFFSVLTFLPFIAFMFMLEDLGKKDFSKLYCLADDIFAIELIAMVLNFIIYHSSRGDDWSCGTFFRVGGSQAQLFIISAFLMILFFIQYIKYKKWKNLLKAIGSGIILLSTNCWTLSVFLVLGIGLAYILSLTPKHLFILISGFCSIPLALYLILKFAPAHVSYSLTRMLTDTSYFNYRFYKAVVYKITFLDLPSRDILFCLIGNGIGYYTSRAALVCTGYYIDFYNELFSPSISQYTKKYILDYLRYATLDGGSDYGSVLARPYSSILSLMGECGYIGIIVFLSLIKKIIRNKDFGAKLLLCVWLGFCFVECYFEYAKILTMLYFCLLLVCSKNKTQTLSCKKRKIEIQNGERPNDQ